MQRWQLRGASANQKMEVDVRGKRRKLKIQPTFIFLFTSLMFLKVFDMINGEWLDNDAGLLHVYSMRAV